MPLNITSVFISVIIAVIFIKISKSWPIRKKVIMKERNYRYSIIRGKSSDKFLIYFTFIIGAIAIGLAITFVNSSISDAITVFLLGMFFILLGLFITKMTIDNRIEYDSAEIRQYRAFRREVKVIQCSYLKNCRLKNIGPLLILNDGENELFIDLRQEGVVTFLEFIVDKVSNDDVKFINEVLLRNRK